MRKKMVYKERFWANAGTSVLVTPFTTGSVFYLVPTTGTSGTFIAGGSVSTSHWKVATFNHIPGGVDELYVSFRGILNDKGNLTNCTAHLTSIVAVGDMGELGRQSGLDLFLSSLATPGQTSANAGTYGNGCLLVTIPADGRAAAQWATSSNASLTQGLLPISSPVANTQTIAWDVLVGRPMGGGTATNTIATEVSMNGLMRVAIAIAVNTTFTGTNDATKLLGEVMLVGYQNVLETHGTDDSRLRLPIVPGPAATT